MTARRETVLIVDDDDDVARFIEVSLRLENFEVLVASDGADALHKAQELLPNLILLDVMMPGVDGYEVCRRIRGDLRTKHMSIIMLTARSLTADKVVGLSAGADDYIIKPFDPLELVARVKSALRRAREMRAVNPLTQLPGNVQIQDELARLVSSTQRFSLLYIDLDNFKSFNDHYGFLRGDGAIKLLASCVEEAVHRHAAHEGFVGHIGGDDFVAMVHPGVSEAIAKDVIEGWDRRICDLYDQVDREKGHIEIRDRRNELHRVPLTTVSIGIATNQHRKIESHWAASEIAAEVKAFAKRKARSSYEVDRRKD